MQKRIIEGVEVQRSSGNVFADLGLPDAEKLKIKTGLVVEIRKAMRARSLMLPLSAARPAVSWSSTFFMRSMRAVAVRNQ